MKLNKLKSILNIETEYLHSFLKAYYLKDADFEKLNDLMANSVKVVIDKPDEFGDLIYEFNDKFLSKSEKGLRYLSILQRGEENELNELFKNQDFKKDLTDLIKEESLKELDLNYKNEVFKMVLDKADVKSFNLIVFPFFEYDEDKNIISSLDGQHSGRNSSVFSTNCSDVLVHEMCHNLNQNEFKTLMDSIFDYIKEVFGLDDSYEDSLNNLEEVSKNLLKNFDKLEIKEENKLDILSLKDKLENNIKNVKNYNKDIIRDEVRSRLVEVYFLMDKIGIDKFKDFNLFNNKDLRILEERLDEKKETNPLFSLFNFRKEKSFFNF